MDTTSFPPGRLENLRRLVMASQWNPDSRSHENPKWLLDCVLELGRFRSGISNLDDPALTLIYDLVEPTNAASAYCGYNASIDVAIGLAGKGANVSLDLESPELAALAACLALAADLPLQIRLGDPVALTLEDRDDDRATIYEVSFVALPFNVRPHEHFDVSELDPNSPPLPNSDGMGIALAVTRSSKLAICITPQSFLFQATKAQQAFKSYILRETGLETVICLPSGTVSRASIYAALLVFRTEQYEAVHTTPMPIFIVDARGGKTGQKIEATVQSEVSALLREPKVSDISAFATFEEIAANDFVLLPERYILTPQAQRLRQRALASETILLEEAVEFIRPQTLRNPKDQTLWTESLIEVGVSDIDEAGLIRSPEKQVTASPDIARQALKARLEPGDVLFVIKGSVGKVGFVRDIPEGRLWIAGQSYVILRVRRHGPVDDPRIVFRYLTSSLGQAMIETLRVGSYVPSLQMADVRRLRIEVPPRDEQAQISRDIEELFEIQEQIERLRTKLADRKKIIWPEDGNSYS